MVDVRIRGVPYHLLQQVLRRQLLLKLYFAGFFWFYQHVLHLVSLQILSGEDLTRQHTQVFGRGYDMLFRGSDFRYGVWAFQRQDENCNSANPDFGGEIVSDKYLKLWISYKLTAIPYPDYGKGYGHHQFRLETIRRTRHVIDWIYKASINLHNCVWKLLPFRA